MDKIQLWHTRYRIKETPFVQPTIQSLYSSRSMVKEASYSFSLEKSEWDHKSGQYIKAVKIITRNINLFLIQLGLNCFTETQWLQRHHKLLMAKTMLCPTLPAIFHITFQCTEQSGSRQHREQLFHMLGEKLHVTRRCNWSSDRTFKLTGYFILVVFLECIYRHFFIINWEWMWILRVQVVRNDILDWLHFFRKKIEGTWICN